MGVDYVYVRVCVRNSGYVCVMVCVTVGMCVCVMCDGGCVRVGGCMTVGMCVCDSGYVSIQCPCMHQSVH